MHSCQARPTRRALAAACAVLCAAVLGACTAETAPDPAATPTLTAAVREPGSRTVTLSVSDPAELAVNASRLVFDRSPVLVVAAPEDDAAAAALTTVASALDAPVLLADGPDDQAVRTEAERLGARLAVVVEEDRLAVDGTEPTPSSAHESAVAAGLDVFQIDPQAATDSRVRGGAEAQARLREELREDVNEAMPGVLPDTTPERLTEVLALVDPAPGQEAALATLRAAGAATLAVPGGDPGASGNTVRAIATARALTVIGVGPGFDDAQTFAWQVASAEGDMLLPGGTQRLDQTRFVAVPARVGDATEKVLAASATAVGNAGDPEVVPAVVLRASRRLWVRGEDGTYLRTETVAALTPMVEAAQSDGRYVVLELEGGAITLLDQVSALDPLLARGGVGVLVHPEHRRSGAGRARGGAVSAAELGAVVDHLAELAIDHSLPQILLAVDSLGTAVEDVGTLVHRPQVAVADSTVLEGLP